MCIRDRRDDAQILEQGQRAGLVGGVIRHGNGSAVRNILQVRGFAGIDAHRLIVHSARAYQLGAVFLVEILQIREMLEIVGIQIAGIDVYKRQGWDTATGIPTRATLEKFGLADMADKLEEYGILPA